MAVEEGLLVSFKGDSSDLEKAADHAAHAMHDVTKATDEAKESMISWTQFVGQRMGSYMKQYGGHAEAIKKIAEEWKEYKASGVNALGSVQRPVEQAGTSLKKLSGTSGAAQQSLLNLSRVAQDAPYGFIGIANNLNPLLESFQRLQAETGSTRSALSAMLTGLTGPAGIGLALGIVSSLLVQFGNELFNSGRSAEKAAKDLELYKKALQELGDETKRINTDVSRASKIKVAQINAQGDDPQAVFIEEQRALIDQRNRILAEQTTLRANLAQLENRGLKDSKEALEARKQLQSLEKEYYDTQADIEVGAYNNQERIRKEREEAAKKAKDQREKESKDWEKYLKDLEWMQRSLQKYLHPSPDYNKDAPKATPLFSNAGNFLDSVRSLSERNSPKIEIGGFNSYDIDRESILGQYTKAFNWVGKQLPKKVQLDNGLFKDVDAITSLDQLQEGLNNTLGQAHAQLQSVSDMVNSTLTPAFDNLFNAIIAGEDPLKSFFSSIGQSVQQLISQLIAAAIQAAVISMITGGASGGGQSFLGAFKNITGFASGGIVSGPTLGLIGEGSGTSASNPEVIAPLDQLKKFISPNNGGSIQVTGRLRGNDMVLQNSRTQRKQRRLR